MGRPFMFYLRPRYYKYLCPEDRPDDWEIFSEEDDLLWEREQEEMRLNKEKEKLMKTKKKAGKNPTEAVESNDVESISSDRLDNASNVSPSVDGDDDGDETEDEEGKEPDVKKIKADM